MVKGKWAGEWNWMCREPVTGTKSGADARAATTAIAWSATAATIPPLMAEFAFKGKLLTSNMNSDCSGSTDRHTSPIALMLSSEFAHEIQSVRDPLVGSGW
jgi:hypothetical protein